MRELIRHILREELSEQKKSKYTEDEIRQRALQFQTPADFFKNDKGVNIDYFCAFKDYDSFYTSNPVTDDEYKFKKLDTDDIIINLKKHFNLKDTFPNSWIKI